MATTRPFAYNTGSPISGTEQFGNLAVGLPDAGFESTGLDWWNGPDEDLGYVIAQQAPVNQQPTPVNHRWNSTYIGSGMSLSENDATVTNISNNFVSAISTRKVSLSQKVMFSLKLNDSLTVGYIGFGQSSMNVNSYAGSNDGKSIAFGSDGKYYYFGGVQDTGLPTWGSDNDLIDVAIDLGNNKIYIRVNGGNWNGTRNEDPGGGGSVGTAGLNNLYPTLTLYSTTSTISATLQPTSQYSIPTGYTFLGDTFASVGFFRTDNFDDNEFINLVKVVSGYQATSAINAKTWLESNGYWTSWYGPVLSLDAGNTASYPGTGTVWTDLIDGKQFNLINGPGYDPSNGGKFYFFAPGGQYAQCDTSLPNLSTWSIGVWHYYDGTNIGGAPCIITEIYPGTTYNINYSLGNNNGGFSSGFFDGGAWRVTDGYFLTPNNWYYIVGTYDGNTISLYVNNTLVDSTNHTGTPISSQDGIRLMMRWDLPDFWGGYLATVDIYDKSLNSLEITNIWNTTKSRFGL